MEFLIRQTLEKNDEQVVVKPPFLGRNYRKMKQFRKDCIIKQENELKFNLVPLIREIHFEGHTEDNLTVQRKAKKRFHFQ